MPPLSRFKTFDVRPALDQGREPLPEILERAKAIRSGEGLAIVAPFLPAPLIERLGGEGFKSRVDRGRPGTWIAYFWREGD